MHALDQTALADASVPSTATFLEAARVLSELDIAALAVVDANGRVLGMFTQDDLLAGVFPRYLTELRHTKFLEEETDALAARLGKVVEEPVTEHMREPETVDIRTSAAHIAERFLHCEAGALAVVDRDRFVGMVGEGEFCRAILKRVG